MEENRVEREVFATLEEFKKRFFPVGPAEALDKEDPAKIGTALAAESLAQLRKLLVRDQPPESCGIIWSVNLISLGN